MGTIALKDALIVAANTAEGLDASGTTPITYSDTVWDDLRIVPGAFTFSGSGDPVLRDWTLGGTAFKVYKFEKDDMVFASCQMPHDYKEGTDLKPHIHWTPCDRGNEESGALVGWKVDYSIADIGEAFGNAVTLDFSDACTGTDHLHEITDSLTITGTGFKISHILMLKIYRTDTGADDTWAGTTTQAPALLEFDIHYEKSTAGSSTELTK